MFAGHYGIHPACGAGSCRDVATTSCDAIWVNDESVTAWKNHRRRLWFFLSNGISFLTRTGLTTRAMGRRLRTRVKSRFTRRFPAKEPTAFSGLYKNRVPGMSQGGNYPERTDVRCHSFHCLSVNRFFDCESARNAKSDFNSHPSPSIPLPELRGPTPHPDPLPSHRMGAERESVFGALRRDRQQADAHRFLENNGANYRFRGSMRECFGEFFPVEERSFTRRNRQ